jgi:asparagine synthase (glutamine-hydrolysing)
MCGIAGFVNLDGAPADASVIARMTELQRHRGPDDQGLRLFSLSSGCSQEIIADLAGAPPDCEGALGFNRLKILDLTQCGHQPMVGGDGRVILAFNGEIYNAFDYRAELERAGCQFRSRTDTEVILHLYERHGWQGMLDRLNGMFAIVIVDLRSREVLMARDHFGIKPLYWTVAGSTLLFASEVKSFLAHASFRAECATEHLDEYLAFRTVSGEDTLLKGVRHLAPAHSLRLAGGRITTGRYWAPSDSSARRSLSDAQALDNVDRVLRASVRSQLQSDVKVGCQLSGGIDSSLVALFARSHFDANMETFSVVFDDPAYSERPWIEQAATAARAKMHLSTLTPEIFVETLDRVSWHMDQPVSHPNSIGIWLLARDARREVTVLLSGEGADEVFGGYSRFYYANLRRTLSPWLPVLRRVPVGGKKLVPHLGSESIEAFINASRFQHPDHLRELRPGMNLAPAMVKRRVQFLASGRSHLDRCLQYSMQTYLVDLLVRQDKMTMAHSVENRVPFLDRHLVDLARSLSPHCLVSGSMIHLARPMRATKVILKALARRTFSETFVYRRKSGFPLPLAQFFATPAFQSLMEERLLPGMAGRGWLDAGAVRRRWKALPGASQGDAEALWIAVALELWAQQFLDGRHAH